MKVVGNGTVITRNQKDEVIIKGAVAFDKGSIVAVGKESEIMETFPNAEYINAHGMLIMPGLINAHQHIYSAFARGMASPYTPDNFLDILNQVWWRIDRKLTLENVYYSAMATYIEGVKNGVTTVIDHHAGYGAIENSLFTIARAAKEMSVRSCLAYEISDRDGEEKCYQAIRENMNFIAYANQQQSDMVKGLVGLHASFTLSDDTLEKCIQENQSHAGYHVHIAEGIYDEVHCEKTYQKTVVQRLYDAGILSEKTIAGHCIHINEEDMDILKETKTKVVHNPESNMGNAVGAPDVIKMLDRGILVGLGTDGYTNDMFESLKVANILQKHNRKLADRGFGEACQLLFKNNAKMASEIFGCQLGVLQKGAAADIVIVDYEPYTPLESKNINGHLMFGMQGAMTDTTIIQGEVVMRHRKLVEVDEKEILCKSRESALELWSRMR